MNSKINKVVHLQIFSTLNMYMEYKEDHGFIYESSVDTEKFDIIKEFPNWKILSAYINKKNISPENICIAGHDACIYYPGGQSPMCLYISFNSLESIKEIFNKLRPFFYEETEDENKINLSLSYYVSGSPFSHETIIDVPKWENIKDNYHPSTAKHFEKLLHTNANIGSGKLIIIHGEPGTGKTYAIRSLLREWKKVIKCYYIMDVENFFNIPSYLLSLIKPLLDL